MYMYVFRDNAASSEEFFIAQVEICTSWFARHVLTTVNICGKLEFAEIFLRRKRAKKALLEEKGSILREKCFQKSKQALEVYLIFKVDHKAKTDEHWFLTSASVSSGASQGCEERVYDTLVSEHPRGSLLVGANLIEPCKFCELSPLHVINSATDKSALF